MLFSRHLFSLLIFTIALNSACGQDNENMSADGLARTSGTLTYDESATLPENIYAPDVDGRLSALALADPDRADVMVKYVYAKHLLLRSASSFPKEMYYHHLRVWNGFFEHEPRKTSFEDYASSFELLIDSMQSEGFSPGISVVPLDIDGTACNGGHRIATALLFDLPVSVVKRDKRCGKYTFEYFRRLGLPEKYLDEMALQFVKLRPDTHIMILYPSAVGRDSEVEDIIREHARIVHKKSVFFSETGGLNVILHAYEDEAFIKDRDGNVSDSAYYKASMCFPLEHITSSPARIYLLESRDNDAIVKAKRAIRELYQIANHSVHTTDTHEQAVVMAKAFFNENSIHFLNNRRLNRFDRFERLFNIYRSWLKEKGPKEDFFAVDSSAVMAAYGLRDCRDLDYLHFEKNDVNSGLEDISSHNSELKYHPIMRDDILFDPQFHFYYKGVKFGSLAAIRAMKVVRNESKDIKDIQMINELL